MKPLNIKLNIDKEKFKEKLNIVDGKDGIDGTDGKDAVVDYAKIISLAVKKIPKFKERSVKDIIEELKGKLSYDDLNDLPNLNTISAKDYAFLELTDTPKSYVGQAGNALIVKSDEKGLEFGSIDLSGYLKLDQTTPQSVINGTPSFADIKITGANITGATYPTINDFHNSFGSCGRKTGGAITDATGGYIAVSAGTGFIKATDDDNAQLLAFNFPAPTNIQIPASSIRYIGVEYNSGTPRVVARTAYNWNLDSEFPLGEVVNENINGTAGLHILNNPWWVTDGTTNIIERFKAEGRVVRDENVGGLMLSVTGTRNIAVTAGTLWSNLNEFPVSALNTASAGTFEYYWYSSTGGWQDSDATQFSVLQYNDVTQATLQNLGVAKYMNAWVYAETDDDEIAVLYGQTQYNTASDAEMQSSPANVPVHLALHGILIGRIILKQGTATPIAVQSAFTTKFSTSVATNHANLINLDYANSGHTGFVPYTGATANVDLGNYNLIVDKDGSNGLMKHAFSTGVISYITDGSANWNDAYGWGNHAAAGYAKDTYSTFRAFRDGGQRIDDDTWIRVEFNVLNWDWANEYDFAGSFKFITKSKQYIDLKARVKFDRVPTPAADSYALIRIMKNGNVWSYGQSRILATASGDEINGKYVDVMVTDKILVDASNDEVWIEVYQSSGGAVDLVGSTEETYFTAHGYRVA